MTEDWNDPNRPLFANMDDEDEQREQRAANEPATGNGVDPLSIGAAGSGAIALGAATGILEPPAPDAGDDAETDPDQPIRPRAT